MASTTEEKPAADPDYGAKEVAPPPPPPLPSAAQPVNYFLIDLVLRVILFAAALTSVVVIVTGNQTLTHGVRGVPAGLPVPAKFQHSPAFIYFVAALSVTGLYSLITALASFAVSLKPNISATFLVHFAFLDVIILGLAASATGTAGGVAYVGLKGNSHVQWNKICYAFDKYCKHVGSAIAVSLFGSFVLVLLIWLSIFNIRSRIPK